MQASTAYLYHGKYNIGETGLADSNIHTVENTQCTRNQHCLALLVIYCSLQGPTFIAVIFRDASDLQVPSGPHSCVCFIWNYKLTTCKPVFIIEYVLNSEMRLMCEYGIAFLIKWLRA